MPEREKLPVEERAEEFPGTTPEIPVEVENKGVVSPTISQFPGQVTDDQGRPLITTPENQEIKIELPRAEGELASLAKGDTSESSTWFGAQWFMRFKKALHFGWKILVGRGEA